MKRKFLLCFFLATAALAGADDFEVGHVFETLTVAGGKVYERAKVTKIEPHAVTVMHAGGIARLAMTDLPDAIRSGFGYDADKAMAAAKAQAANDAATRSRLLRIEAERLKTEAEEKVMAAMIENAVQCRFEVFEVLPSGVKTWRLEWLDKNRRAHPTNDVQFIAMDTAKFNLYEGQELVLMAADSGTINLDGRVLKLWTHVPDEAFEE